MKKILSLLILLLLSLTFVIKTKADVIVKETLEEEVLDGGVLFSHQTIATNAYNNSLYTNNDVFSYTVNGDNKEVKLASWSYMGKYATSLVTLDRIAKDYEAQHPGWIVVGGINAEGYHQQNGSTEISNMFVQDYDLIRTGVSSENFKELIGFRDDRSHFIKRVPSFTKTMILRLYDEVGNTIGTLNVDDTNRLPNDDELTLVTRDIKNSLDFTNYFAVKGSYEFYRPETFFIPGTYSLSKTSNGITLKGDIEGEYQIGEEFNQFANFYLVTKNSTVKEKILTAKNIRCQYEFTDEFSEASSVVGYMYKLVENGKVKLPTDVEDNSDDFRNGYTTSDDSFTYGCAYYNTTGKERAAIGFKADGSIVLLTANVGKGGPTQYELGNILKNMNCENAYQFDGGGSVTFLKRNEMGNFKMLNTPGDGNPRSIATGVFLVVRDPKIKIGDTTRNTVTIDVPTDNTIKNVVANINGKEYKLTQGTNVIEGLEEDTKYDIYCTYDILSHLDNSTYISTRTRTYQTTTKAFEYPDPAFKAIAIGKNIIKVEKQNLNDQIFDVIIHLGSSTYMMNDEKEYVISDLISDTEYNIYFTFSVKDKETGKTYTKDTEAVTVKTLSYDLPEIKEFKESKKKENSLSVSYEYVDNDNLVEKAYILINGKEKELSSMLGSERFSDLDFTKNVYELTLVLEGHTKEGESFKITSEVLKYDEVKDEKPQEKKKKCGKKSAELIISFLAATSLMGIVLRKKK